MIATDDFIIALNPHTGGRSLADAFGVKHEHTWPIPKDGRKVYAVIRNPIDWIWSFYWPAYPTPFMDWIKLPLHTHPAAKGRMNMYRDVVDEYFLYEDGLESICKKFGVKSKLKTIGKLPRPFAPYYLPIIFEKYREEWSLYLTWLKY